MKLIYPIYLNVPMLVAFAAAIKDGLALEKSVSSVDGSSQSIKADASAGGGLGKLLGPLLDVSAKLEGSGNIGSEKKETYSELRKHSEASIAIWLYDVLTQQDGAIIHPTTIHEISELPNGSLVELKGTASKNAVDTVIDTIEAISIMTKLTQTNSSVSNQHGKPGKAPEAAQAQKIADVLRNDRERTPISNVIIKCDNPKDVHLIASLRRESLRDLTLSELEGNTVNVLGKVVRYIPAGTEISAFENYGLALPAKEKVKEMFAGLSKQEFFVGKLDKVVVQGPAVQVFPLMVYV